MLLKIELYKKPVFLIVLLIGLHFGVIGVAISTALYSFYAMIINFGTMGKIIDYTFIEQAKDLLDVAKLAAIMGIIVYAVNYFNINSNWIELILKAILRQSLALLVI